MPYAKGEGPSVVIALGGNALGNTPQEQLELVKNTAKHIVDMVGDGVNVVVSHGNGPQVGMINNAFAYAAANDGKTPEMPFPEAGAMSQGYIGYQLSQAILNDLKARGIMRSTANVITQTVVSPDDPAFQNPTKPVGAFMTEEEAKAKAAETGWTFKEDAGRGWRQVVASPKPERIVEFDAVKDLMDAGYIVVSTGGGGVPVFETEDGYEGVPAVIDKDRSSAKLAADFGADMLVILTAVEKVCINFNKPDQQELSSMTVAEARKYIEEGQFAPARCCPRSRPASSTSRHTRRARPSSPRSSAPPPAWRARRAPSSPRKPTTLPGPFPAGALAPAPRAFAVAWAPSPLPSCPPLPLSFCWRTWPFPIARAACQDAARNLGSFAMRAMPCSLPAL